MSTTYENCIREIRKAAGEILSDDDVERLVETVQRKMRSRRRAKPLEDERLALAEIAKGVASEERLAALVEKRAAAVNLIRRQQRGDFYTRFEGKEAEAVSTLNAGSQKAGAGNGRSVDAQQRALRADLMGPMVAELRAAGLLETIAARHPDLERDIARNLWEITTAHAEKRPAVAQGSEQARDAAKILSKYQEAARLMQNDAGAWIAPRAGWVVRQAHDMFKIRRAKAEGWIDAVERRLDPKTFEDVGLDPTDRAQVRDFLKTVWTELSTGEHYRSGGGEADALAGFKGGSNVAKKISEHRVLQFKSADDWLAYNAQFGPGGLMEAVVQGLHHAADTTALMRTWGTNPEAAFAADLTRMREAAARRGDAKQVQALKSWRLQAEMDQITGAARVPGDPSWAKIGAFTRAMLNLSSLGGVVLSSLPDNAISAAVLHHHGIGFFEAHAEALADLVRGRSSGETREIADHLGAGIDGVIGDVAARYAAGDSLPGTAAKMQNWFFKLNLLSWWTDAKTTGAGLMMAHNLARNLGRDFETLDPLLKTSLTRYGIGADQWKVLRQAELVPRSAAGEKIGDKPYLMPDAIDRLDDAAIRPLAPDSKAKTLQRARDELRLSLRTFYAEELAQVQTLGGARERALATWGTRPGTPLGEAVRFVMQFKMYPITYATRHLTRELRRGGVPGMVHMILATTALGYLSLQAKELAKGRQPRPLDKEHWYQTVIAAAVQGGGLGIYGDFLFGEANRFGQGPIETLAGPGVGKLGELYNIFGAARQGEPADAAAKLAKAGVNALPGINLFYTRAALDYLLLYQLQERANPGYLRRMEQRLERDNGQKFILPPSTLYGGAR